MSETTETYEDNDRSHEGAAHNTPVGEATAEGVSGEEKAISGGASSDMQGDTISGVDALSGAAAKNTKGDSSSDAGFGADSGQRIPLYETPMYGDDGAAAMPQRQRRPMKTGPNVMAIIVGVVLLVAGVVFMVVCVLLPTLVVGNLRILVPVGLAVFGVVLLAAAVICMVVEGVRRSSARRRVQRNDGDVAAPRSEAEETKER